MDPELYEDLGDFNAPPPPFEAEFGGSVYEDAVKDVTEGGAGVGEGAGGINLQGMGQGMEDQIFLWAMGIESLLSITVTVLGIAVLWWTFCRKKARSAPGGAEQGRRMTSTALTSRRVAQASLLPTVAEEEEELEEVAQGPGGGYELRSKNKA